MDTTVPRAQDLLKTSEIYKARADDSLSSALSHLTRTHDAVFVFDEHDKFAGVINPYYVTYKAAFPPETKLSHCLFHPPLLTPETELWDIAQLMTESKVYYLPVFEKNKFMGIVTINRVLRALMTLGIDKQLSFTMKKNVLTLDRESTLTEAYHLMRDQQVSRLPIIDEHNHLVGMLTRFDLRALVSAPQERPGFSRIGEKEKQLDKHIEGHYRKMVHTVSATSRPSEIIILLLEKNIGSVVVVDGERRPVGIVSTHDVLKAVDNMRPKADGKIELHLSPEFIHQTQLTEMVNKFMDKIEKANPIQSAHFVLKTEKNRAGKIRLYEVSLQVNSKHSPRTFAKSEGHDWKVVVHEVLGKIKSQLFD
jgi:CBS domain-containing protein